MPSDKQLGVLALFEHVEKPATEDAFLGLPSSGATPLAPGEEISTITKDLPNLEELGIGITPRGKPCSLFDWDIMEEASNLASLFMGKSSYEEFVRTLAEVRTLVNEEIYVYAMMYAFLNRKDARQFQLPALEEVVPYWFFPATVFADADRSLMKASNNKESRVLVQYQYSHNNLDPEFRMAYFREDIALNSHHWHWHVAYPTIWTPRENEIKDRKGELFYYMHQQIMARYDTDRMANNLSRVRPLNDFRQGLGSGYFPNLMSTISGRQYASRPANMDLVDTNVLSLDRLELWKTRVMEAIHSKSAFDSSMKSTPMVDPRGIDTLGNILEASAISINRTFYGDYHNAGHRIISRAHDPDGRFGGEIGVMGSSATAMRDPIFYLWHKNIDDMFNEYKLEQKPYLKAELEWSGIEVVSIAVFGAITNTPNFLKTFWTEKEALLSRGVDFGRENPVAVSFKHLDHEEFVYTMRVNNTSGKDQEAVVRLFIAPVNNEREVPLTLAEQRRLFIELDKFTVTVKSGMQTLTRKSEDSNVTMPTARGFEQLEKDPESAATASGFCGCGWPHHLLLPKGRVNRMRFVLFAMLTNWEEDKVANLPEKSCGESASYCGIRDQLYPDKRSMGFPFDKPFVKDATLNTFKTRNMTTTNVVIVHADETKDTKGIFRPNPIS